ncbi:MAG: hypothetical protein V4587_16295, partial [Acidobacteriota bacterium]
HFLAPMVVGETADIQGEGQSGFRPTMSESTDVNVDIVAGFNSGDLASTDVNAEAEKSGTHSTRRGERVDQIGGGARAKTAKVHPHPAGYRGAR